LKNQLKILSTLILIFSINVAFANDAENNLLDPQEQEQPKQQGLVNDQNGQLEDQKQEEKMEYNAPETESAEIDSVEDDSVSKYNFIFYFLYKFKYEEEA
jgi:hypothetical protein